jgi:hypothetical protein
MTDINQLVDTTFHTADADVRMAEADAKFLNVFLSLKGEARAARWRGLDYGAKYRLVVRRIEQMGYDWMPSDVEAQIAKYDQQYAPGPVEAAVEGALERLAIEHANAARLADRLGDKAHRKAERAAATAFTNALVQYKAGVRPQLLDSGAWLIPSSTPGKSAHIVTMDGDWTCSCAAGANMHWPLALIIALEVAQDDMQAHDDGDVEEEITEEAISGSGPHNAPQAAQQLLAERLAATAAILDAMRQAQRRCDPPAPEPCPLGDEEGDELPSGRTFGQRLAQARRVYLVAA